GAAARRVGDRRGDVDPRRSRSRPPRGFAAARAEAALDRQPTASGHRLRDLNERMRDLLRAGSVFLFVLAIPTPATAPSDPDRATARALAREAEQALNAKDYGKAVDLYTRADALVHAPTLLVARARAEMGMGKLVEAEETLARVVREGAAPSAPPAFAKAVDSA